MRLLLWLVSLVAFTISCHAEFLVDDSPDTLGVGALETGYGNQYFPDFDSTFTGGEFTLAEDSTITGASIFSRAGIGHVGDDVQILIFGDPLSAPIENISATLDAVDSLYTTTQSDMSRKHASFDSIQLAAGTYWFAMPSDFGSGDILQATGDFGDGVMRQGVTVLSYSYTDSGKPFMQLEGTAVPEPATWVLIGLGGCAMLFRIGKRR